MEETIFTIFDMLYIVEQARVEFIEWFKGELKARGLSARGAANAIGLSHPTITDIVVYGNMPSFETCLKLASYFDRDPVWMLRFTGLLPKETQVENFEEWKHILSKLLVPDRDELFEIAKVKLQRYENLLAYIEAGISRLSPEDRRKLVDRMLRGR